MLQERQQSCCVAVKNTLYTIHSKRNNLRKYAHYASTRIFKESHVPYCRRDALERAKLKYGVWLRKFTSDTCIFAPNKSILHATFALNTLSNRHRTFHHFIGIERWCLQLCVSTSFSTLLRCCKQGLNKFPGNIKSLLCGQVQSSPLIWDSSISTNYPYKAWKVTLWK